MAEDLTYHLRLDLLGDHEGRHCVAQIVDTHLLEADSLSWEISTIV